MRMRGLLMLAFLTCAANSAPARDRIDATEGKLVAVHERSITVRNDQGTRTFRISADTKIWRGDFVDLHQLRPGDDLGVRSRVSDRSGEATAPK